MKNQLLPVLALVVLGISACGSVRNGTIDRQASLRTKMLFHNLDKLSEKHTLFGHQHATEYGHGWWGDADRSDVKSVTGSHPAVIGIDFMDFSGRSPEAVEQEKERLRNNAVATYDRGGVITAAWHFRNPVDGNSFYWRPEDSLSIVARIIPGGTDHEKYRSILDHIGSWAKSLTGRDGELAPVIFRPFHEFDGGWFWWGKPHTSREDFITLWRFTVSYLRDTLDVHNLLYAYSPDRNFLTETQFLERYPGDEWVDMVGMDNYGDMGRDRYAPYTAAMKLKIVSDYARKARKLAALTETGLESIPDTSWWTQTLLRTMKMHDTELAFVLVWRNDTRSPTHYYAPFPGQVSVPDFMRFYRDNYTLFEEDLEGIYTRKRR
ncbi:glycoside hydrolase family 26 protein [Flavilitoribacter nigricans]|uniref:Mannan endo-1,4-beta-mannosidase n=1 Tax=Flavilitoribacter nigricans (strain ATCC 23147 / DSM 23189 / NBRC 102662 / NCIMB 1420 / SS-2) TaxID=1122177 RepID=A0A2D0MZP6_FLAN2|nr:glycosyl hydrolase [Flavilitoribacter nigricans]PHN01650.1 beta-mannosidase [Flavilitoribacter nigricans DSM 23189 = NBRC 102662]